MDNKKRSIAIPFIMSTMLLMLGSGLLIGYKLFAPKAEKTVTIQADVILTALHDRGFLVTQTYFFDTPVTIEKSTGSALKDFFFGQTIEARGTMEVNLGVNLADVGKDDVQIDAETNEITLNLPPSELFNSRLVGPIEVKNTQGILKRLLDSDDGYNEALSALMKAAEETAQQPALLERANERAEEDIRRLLEYVVPASTIKIERQRDQSGDAQIN